MHKLQHYLGQYTATQHEGSARGHGYEYYICDTCGVVCDEPRNKFLVDFLYFVSSPLKLFGQTCQDNFVDSMVK